VVFGNSSAFPSSLEASALDGANGFKILGLSDYDAMGFSVSDAGDINGDGVHDIIVGAPYSDTNPLGAGESYVVFGSSTGFGPFVDVNALNGKNGFKLVGEFPYSYSGRSVSSAGDVDGDGVDDLVVGTDDDEAYVVFGRTSRFRATIELAELDGNRGVQIRSLDSSLGYSVSSAGDMNGDGFDDMVFGDNRAVPRMWVVFGNESRFDSLGALHSVFTDPEAAFPIIDTGLRYSGWSVSSAGDFNGDGFSDVIFGSPFDFSSDPQYPGYAFVVFGKASGFGELDVTQLDGNNGFKIAGEAASRAGISASAAGDVNADGFADLIVGASVNDANGDNSGSSYVIYGSMPGEAVSRTGTHIDNTIHGGDLDDVLQGLQGDDTLIGHGGNDHMDGSQGNDALYGGDGRDKLNGGAGDDVIDGGPGNSLLIGGAGADHLFSARRVDTFAYVTASDSTGASYDVIERADFTRDRIDLVGAVVGGVDAAVEVGPLSTATFDEDLAASVDATRLAAGHAVLFAPDAGELAGHDFLVIDMNGVGGYQTGEDIVIELLRVHELRDLGLEDFI
jgi:hypothetical protein